MTRVDRLFGTISARSFLRDYWQRRPLLVRAAIPAFTDPLDRREVLALAGNPDAQARLVRRRGTRWSLEQGPIAPREFARLPKRDWTVLVQDTQHFSRAAQRLLEKFSFIPHARVDDLMVSYAVPGGSVAPTWIPTMSSSCRGWGGGAGGYRARKTTHSAPAFP